MSAEPAYFLKVGEKQKGPFRKKELNDMVQLGVISGETLCSDPQGVWHPVRNIIAPPQAEMPDDYIQRQAEKAKYSLLVVVVGAILIALGWIVMARFVTAAIRYIETPSL